MPHPPCTHAQTKLRILQFGIQCILVVHVLGPSALFVDVTFHVIIREKYYDVEQHIDKAMHQGNVEGSDYSQLSTTI